MLDLDEARNESPAVPRDSSTIVVLRQAEGAIELFCVERHPSSRFLGGAIVFPGGKVDEADWEDCWDELTTSLRPRVRALGEERAARAFAVAALRELLEEAAILPVSDGTLSAERTLALRQAMLAEGVDEHAEALAFAELLRAHQLTLATDRLEALWRWITPAAEPRRYDTRFYLLALPDGQVGRHDERETTHSFWATPDDLLARWHKSDIILSPPTFCTIELLRGARTLEAAFAIAERQSLDPICPYATFDGTEMVIAMPGDPLYPEPGRAPADPAAPTRFVLSEGRLVARRVQRPSR